MPNDWIHHTVILSEPKLRNLLIDSLENLKISGLEEINNNLVIYYQDELITNQVKTLCTLLSLNCRHSIEINKSQNWNAVWESSFDPVRVEDFCIIYAHFHKTDLSTFQYKIQITPQMSFGTGHHETTRLMILQMKKMELKNKSLFDFGCGTGILAILAEMMGARKIYGVDNMPWAVENARENALTNDCEDCSFAHADHAGVPGQKFDIIVANIIRKVILDNMKILSQQVVEMGYLLISGFLRNDAQKMIFEAKQHGFKLVQESTENEWVCQLYQKEGEV